MHAGDCFSIPISRFNERFACCSILFREPAPRWRRSESSATPAYFFLAGFTPARRREMQSGANSSTVNVLRVLHNPRYAGAFVFGRSRTRKNIDGECRVEQLPREEWHTFLPESHPAYISWEAYERNLKRLRENAQIFGADRRNSPPREDPALLQGLIVCGKCGRRMTLR